MSAEAYIDELNCTAIGEIHLGGHSTDVLKRTGPKASLIEWDTDVPEWSLLNSEVMQAACLLEQQRCQSQ